ncbi:MAG: L,D-transpeptidase family protein [candidate division WOR-3 bacterium]|nr:L,D-transpeptidase family protein [candidate division WOR-3 bacterium]
MIKKTNMMAFICIIVIISSYFAGCARNLSEKVQRNLRLHIESAGEPPHIKIDGEIIYSSIILPRFYEQRAYMPAWSSDTGFSLQIAGLVKAISGAEGQCFMPDDYHLKKITAHMLEINKNYIQRKTFDAAKLAELDLLLTDAFLIYSAHLLEGRTNPETRCAEWNAECEEADLAVVLQNALNSGTIESTINELLPREPNYFLLCRKRREYAEIRKKGGWPTIPDGPDLTSGAQDNRVPAIRERLTMVGDLPRKRIKDVLMFDEEMERAVRQFQRRHGLTPDGKIDARTIGAMNIPVEDRLKQIEVNMERWRWCQRDFGERYILVNIANFELDVFEHDTTVLSMRAVVGKPYRSTPVFSGRMTYLVFNPYWNVPKTIAVEDILPKIKKNKEYLTKNNYTVLQGWGGGEREIEPSSINWAVLNENYFPYRFRQNPGPTNALGRIKFMFPNEYDVYIHDTPARDLFNKDSRDFSSGCIRIERPAELAEYVLNDTVKWTRAEILKVIRESTERTVGLSSIIPVHLLYWTAWVSNNGLLNFRNDIYNRDEDIYLALIQPPCPQPQK